MRATRWATNVGFTIAFLFIVGGIVLIATGNIFNGLWVAFIGWYLAIVARDSYKQSILSKMESRPLARRDWLQQRLQGRGISIHPKTSSEELSPAYIYQDVQDSARTVRLPRPENIEQVEEIDRYS